MAATRSANAESRLAALPAVHLVATASMADCEPSRGLAMPTIHRGASPHADFGAREDDGEGHGSPGAVRSVDGGPAEAERTDVRKRGLWSRRAGRCSLQTIVAIGLSSPMS